MQQRNFFAGPYLDRAAHLRTDPQWFANALADERSRALPVWNSRNLILETDPPRAIREALRAGSRPVRAGRAGPETGRSRRAAHQDGRFEYW